MQNQPTQTTQSSSPLVATASPTLTPSASLIAFLVITIALILAAASFGYKNYRARQRSQLLQRQIAMLEAMWRISSKR